MEVVSVHLDEELVHHAVGPVAVHSLRHNVRAVGKVTVESAC